MRGQLTAALGVPRLHHVGIIVRDLPEAIERYRQLGFGEPARFEVPDQGVQVVSYVAGPGYLEVMTPIRGDTGVARFLERRGEGLHHVAYAVPDIEAALARLAAEGLELIDATPRRGIHDWRVAFVHPRSCGGVLTELVEE